MTKELIAETLAAHHTWDVKIMKGLMVCAGKGCDWSRKPVKGASNTEAFRQHQADMVAAVLAEQPAPWASRDDLTVFAALLAKLGGEATVTIAEARNVTGVHVTRWDEPEHMRYRFTLDAPELRDVPPGRIALQLPDGSYKSADEIRAEAAASVPKPAMMTAEELHALHRDRRHPAYEYETTEGPRKSWNDYDRPPEGDGWERNTDAGRDGWDRFDYTEESYWRRLKAGL
ncbi:hypothetical protein SEA_VIBAKI_71 [Arthrobacter phage Vibaki]|uniref:Uncharacterized protein n=1 Tax=Arthrobacter phage Vibaki TaxID=2593333 RepID=A0A514TZ25_9CAUD|nr:hypothetical protein HYP95_gp71 [Arthrobacter phage Vibaki]QDK01951.1 hypothetical protein SEA_VIBAKI_71 [Arthrobacter phage Vibaki]